MIGKMTEEQLKAFFETIPLEFSLLDAEDKVVGWNKHETRLFKRPETVVGRDVRKCHPEKSLAKVEQIISEMKEGKRDKARFWIDIPMGPEKKLHKIMIEYYALRDAKKNYLGCIECTQDITEIKKIEGQKRLLD
ncbi:MAG: PAS domain-containing protein [Nanoarchaeota archaeon]|nr:PAS domain-containing protein [Nanoarchaeota archaeon]